MNKTTHLSQNASSNSGSSSPSVNDDQDSQVRPSTTEHSLKRSYEMQLLNRQQVLGFWRKSLMRFCVETKLPPPNNGKLFGMYCNYRILNNNIDYESELPVQNPQIQSIRIQEDQKSDFNKYVQQYAQSVGQLISLWVPPYEKTSINCPINCVASTINYVRFGGKNFGLGVFHQSNISAKMKKDAYQFYYIIIYDTKLECFCEVDMFNFIYKELSTLSQRIARYFNSQQHYEENFKEILQNILKESVTTYFQLEISDATKFKDSLEYDRRYIDYLRGIDENRFEFIILSQKQAENRTFLQMRELWEQQTNEKQRLIDPQIHQKKQISFDYLFFDLEKYLQGKRLNPIPISADQLQHANTQTDDTEQSKTMLQISFNAGLELIDYSREYSQSKFLQNFFKKEEQVIHVGKSLSCGRTLKRNAFLQSFASSTKQGSSGSLVIEYEANIVNKPSILIGPQNFPTASQSQQQEHSRQIQASTEDTAPIMPMLNNFLATAVSTCAYEDEADKVSRKVQNLSKKTVKGAKKDEAKKQAAAMMVVKQREEEDYKQLEDSQEGSPNRRKTKFQGQSDTKKRKQDQAIIQKPTKNLKKEQASTAQNDKEHGIDIEQQQQQVDEILIEKEAVQAQQPQNQLQEQIKAYKGTHNFNLGHTLQNPFIKEWQNCVEAFTQEQMDEAGFIQKQQENFRSADREKFWLRNIGSEGSQRIRLVQGDEKKIIAGKSKQNEQKQPPPKQDDQQEINEEQPSKATATATATATAKVQQNKPKEQSRQLRPPKSESSLDSALRLYQTGSGNIKEKSKTAKNK